MDEAEIDPKVSVERDEHDELESRSRVKRKTEKGQVLYEETVKRYLNKFDTIWSEIEDMTVKLDEYKSQLDFKSLRTLDKELQELKTKHAHESEDFLAFLDRTNTEDSISELRVQEVLQIKCRDIMKELSRRIREARIEATERLSQRGSSLLTRSEVGEPSTIGSFLAKKKMEVEAQRARLQYEARELMLRKQKASLEEKEAKHKAEQTRQKEELDAEFLLLEQERKFAIAEAEVRALEETETGSRHVSPEPSLLQEPVDRSQLTAKYVYESCPENEETSAKKPEIRDIRPPTLNQDTHKSSLNPNAAPFEVKQSGGDNIVRDLTKFLLKKELLFSRFTKFTDRPEVFVTWKTSFRSIADELGVTPFEEVDLLAKYLGPESTKFALSIRAANAAYPDRALKRIWERLEERYGSPELVELALKTKLEQFPRLTTKENKRLYELADILAEIEAAKENPKYSTLLSYFDSSSGIIPIINKLPYNLQDKWTTQASSYKKKNSVSYPPFTFLVQFLQEMSRIRNDPGFQYDGQSKPKSKEHVASFPVSGSSNRERVSVRTNKTEFVSKQGKELSQVCLIHLNSQTPHSLQDCRVFRSKKLADRKRLLKEEGICFRCCNSKHMARDCKVNLRCNICDSTEHCSALHPTDVKSDHPHKGHGGEQRVIDSITTNSVSSVSACCLQICGKQFFGKSCAKMLLVRVYRQGEKENAIMMYALVDDQSNRSLARSEFFDMLRIYSEPKGYTISSCSGTVPTYGRQAYGLVIESWDSTKTLNLPVVTECDSIPCNRDEIGTPDIALHYPHLVDIASEIPPLNDAPILLLLGRDLVEAHHVIDQRVGKSSPYAQKLPLGWALIGEACLDKVHVPDDICVKKTHMVKAGRTSIMPPCTSSFTYSEGYGLGSSKPNDFGTLLFERTADDDKPGLSIEDREFLKIMETHCKRNEEGSWVSPLPFRTPRDRLPDNRVMALKRARILNKTLAKNPCKQEHFHIYMQGILEKHAELAPPLQPNEECWYLPIFGVYHPKKPSKLRVVFDSSAKFENTSLNDVLLCGPDLTNSLVGVLLRFRKDAIGVVADIEQMFFGFIVAEEHRNYLRFLWHRDNDPNKELVEYRMCKHVFGNSPSPAIATYGLRKAVSVDPTTSEEVVNFVNKNFYVDDGLLSTTTPEKAIEIMKKTQAALLTGGNLRLHKVASNNNDVVNAFPPEERASDLENMDLSVMDDVPLQRSLGLQWSLQTDSFAFQVKFEEKPFTKRGVLSTLHSIFDPLGFVAPFILLGRMIFRELMDLSCDWDEPLPVEIERRWTEWKNSASDLSLLQIPRMFTSIPINEAIRTELHVYSDASEQAVAAVAYLKVFRTDDEYEFGFVFGKSKLSPRHGHTVPRLELCSAVLASEIATAVTRQLDSPVDATYFYSDSKVVLGYLNNRTRRFYTYVSNRVERILHVSQPAQWNYIPSEQNPADVGTRGVQAKNLADSKWWKPSFHASSPDHDINESFQMVNPDEDVEVRPMITTMKVIETAGSFPSFSTWEKRFCKFSSWERLVHGVTRLREAAVKKTFHISPTNVKEFRATEQLILKIAQKSFFEKEIRSLTSGNAIPNDSTLSSLNPYIDEEGVLRVGGRLKRAKFGRNMQNPIIVPKSSHIAVLLVRHHHEKVHHQGRHITAGALRTAGYWIIGTKRLVSSILHHCVICAKLRGKLQTQIMADLPACRLKPVPPFTYVGVDTFGHWNVVSRRTRGGHANSKRWAILFTCLTVRAVHIEVVEQMSTSSFINALRRFASIRGKVLEYRSDRGTNFVGSTDTKTDAVNIEDPTIQKFLLSEGSTWIFNPPHSSHFGGVWERMIGVARKIIDALLLENSGKELTHEVLTTFMAEVCMIINSRPIVPVSSDPENPTILSPNVLLTQKEGDDIPPLQNLDIRDMFRAGWKHVQVLAERFWKRWKDEFLQSLQTRRKWKTEKENLHKGDVVLVKEKDMKRSDWPTGLVEEAILSEDAKVRKIRVKVIRRGRQVEYLRPVAEVVLLYSPKMDSD